MSTICHLVWCSDLRTKLELIQIFQSIQWMIMATIEVISFNYFGQQGQSTYKSKNISEKRLKPTSHHGDVGFFLDVDIYLKVYTARTTVLHIIYSEQ